VTLSPAPASSAERIVWRNLLLVLPLAAAAVLHQGCYGSPCQTDDDCSGSLQCHPEEHVCVGPDPLASPFGPFLDVRVESSDYTVGVSPRFTTWFPFEVGSLQLESATITFNGGARLDPFPIGQIGTFNLMGGAFDQTVPIVATGSDHACIDANENGTCGADEPSIVAQIEGGVSSLWIMAPLGGDGSEVATVMPFNGTARWTLEPGILRNPSIAGRWTMVGLFESVEPAPGAARKQGQSVVELEAVPAGSAFKCEWRGFDNPIGAHVAGNVNRIQVGVVLPVPPSPTGLSSIEKVCAAGRLRQAGFRHTGDLRFGAYDLDAGGRPRNLLGWSAPFPVTVDADTETVCIEETGIRLGDQEEVLVVTEWNPDEFDFSLGVSLLGTPRKTFIRTSDQGQCGIGQAEWDLGTSLDPEVKGWAIGASYRYERPLELDDQPSATWSSPARIAELAGVETHGGSIILGGALVQRSGNDQFLRFFGNPAYNCGSPADDGVADVPIQAPAFGLSKLVNDRRTNISGMTFVSNLQLMYAEIETEVTPPCKVEVHPELYVIDPARNHWESNLTRFEGRLFASSFTAQQSPLFFGYDIYEQVDDDNWTRIVHSDDPAGVEAGAINRGCSRSFTFGIKDTDQLVVVYPLGQLTQGICTSQQLRFAVCDVDAPHLCSYGSLTGAIPAQEVNSESAGFTYRWRCPSSPQPNRVERAGLEVADAPAGAYFFVRGFSPATGTGSIDATTFKRDGSSWSGGGYRQGLEEVRTLAGGFPNFDVHHQQGSDDFLLCFSAVESGAQRVRCSQWTTTGSPDPAQWRRLSTFLAPATFGASSPLALVGSRVAARDGLSMPPTLIGPTSGGPGATTVHANQVLESQPCVPGPGVACLGEEDRFTILSDWRTPQGETGTGAVREVTADSGVATFFNPENVELFYKTLDACSLPAFQSKWFFVTGLTNVEVTTHVVDSETGRVRRYFNPLGKPFAPLLDTSAFAACPLIAEPDLDHGDGLEATALPQWAIDALDSYAENGPASPLEPRVLGCTPSATRLCLNDGRFAVEATFAAANGSSGDGKPVYLTADTGAFTFFNPQNLEILVKVLDACATPFDSFWVFAAGLTNVEVHLTVTDTATGATKNYDNALDHPFEAVQDTSAFETCQ
jgi:hypothetical protein